MAIPSAILAITSAKKATTTTVVHHWHNIIQNCGNAISHKTSMAITSANTYKTKLSLVNTFRSLTVSSFYLILTYGDEASELQCQRPCSSGRGTCTSGRSDLVQPVDTWWQHDPSTDPTWHQTLNLQFIMVFNIVVAYDSQRRSHVAYCTAESICFCSSLMTFYHLVGSCVFAGLYFNCLAKCYK